MDLTVDNIFSQVKKLKQNDQISLSKKIALMLLEDEETSKSVKLTGISGLGTHLWKDINIDKYLEEERQW